MKIFKILLVCCFSILLIFGIWKFSKKYPHRFSFDIGLRPYVRDMLGNKYLLGKEVLGDFGRNVGSDAHKDFSSGIFTGDEEKFLLRNSLRYGGTGDHDIYWLQYCSYDALYCKKAYDQFAKSYKFADLVYFVKMLPNVQKKENILPYHVLYCLNQQYDPRRVSQYHEKLYEGDQIYTKEYLMNVLHDIGISNAGYVEQCLEQKNAFVLSTQQDLRFLRQNFQFSGVPANIFWNRYSKKWIFVPGYYEKEDIDKVLQILRR